MKFKSDMDDTFSIRKATSEDIFSIADTYERLLTYEAKYGNTSNWQLDIYPTIKVAEEKIALGTMYVLERGGEICGSMVLDNEQAIEYKDISWGLELDPDRVLVIHTLCIPPEMSGHGYATMMIGYAKVFAKKHHCSAIRIDTYAYNEPAKALYQKNGFCLVGYHDAILYGLISGKLAFLELLLNENIE